MDVQLPGVDGWEATRLLRLLPVPPVVVVLSGGGRRGRRGAGRWRAGRCATCRRRAFGPREPHSGVGSGRGRPGRACSLTGNVSRTLPPLPGERPAERLDPVGRPLQLGAAGAVARLEGEGHHQAVRRPTRARPGRRPVPPAGARCSRTRRRPPRPAGHRWPRRCRSSTVHPPAACAQGGGQPALGEQRRADRARDLAQLLEGLRRSWRCRRRRGRRPPAGRTPRVAAATADSRSGTSRSPLTTPTRMAAATWRRPESSAASRRCRDAARSAFTRASRVAPARSDSSSPVVAKAGPARSQNSRSTRRRDADGAACWRSSSTSRPTSTPS